MISLAAGVRIFVFTGATDMRKSFNGLSGLVAEHFNSELLSGHLFLFFNRKRDCVKILTWDRDGLAIWYKRLEAGAYSYSGSVSPGKTAFGGASGRHWSAPQKRIQVV